MADEDNAVGVVGVGVVVAMPARARMELASTTSLTDTSGGEMSGDGVCQKRVGDERVSGYCY